MKKAKLNKFLQIKKKLHIKSDVIRVYQQNKLPISLNQQSTPIKAIIGDSNKRLIKTYRAIKSNVEDVITLLKTYPHNKDFFQELREKDIDSFSDIEIAAWFLYLNRTAFNGLYRVNKKNQFNAPFGRYDNPTICNEDVLRDCSKALINTICSYDDFAITSRLAKPGDFVYFDPPYVPISVTSSFTSYTLDGFDMKDQVALRNLAWELKQSRVHILLSNSSAPIIKELYSQFTIKEVFAARSINTKGDGRGKIAECLIY